MMSSLTQLKGAAIGLGEPGPVLSELNRLLNEENETLMFVTVLYAVYDPANGILTYANGGHNPPIIVGPDGNSTILPMTGGIALGVAPDFEYEQSTVTLKPGDTIVLYTDGVTEAINDEEAEFGLGRLRDLFAGTAPGTPEEVNAAIFEAVHVFANNTPQSDDITCLALRRSET
jgi:sigma-B regulation protein RsbU (phosphoserine phosphatase)